jgi:hypothetical protein
MSGTGVICSQCGMVSRLVSLEGEIFPSRHTERPMLFQVIECPQCGRLEQPDGHDGRGGAIDISDFSKSQSLQ